MGGRQAALLVGELHRFHVRTRLSSARAYLADRAGLIDSLLERARAVAVAIRARVATVWEIPRLPLRYHRAVLIAAVVREKLRTAAATIARGRSYDVVAHRQAAMPDETTS
ncbi:hypothetical protein [Streptomyces sp. NPDC059943]|uniref:hypothetical protein n=1 Tax=Streptomyces sp. NPDC059943 TaxID=3347010 RepID=UPI0036675441